MKRDAAWTFVLLAIAILIGFTSASYAQVVLYGTVTGCQRDAFGAAAGPDRPLSGVRVLVGQYMNFETGLTGVDFIRNPKGVSGDTSTDEKGNFTVALPKPGTYEVILWKKGYVTEIKSQVPTGVVFNGSICDNIMAPATHQELAFIGGPQSDEKPSLADPSKSADAANTVSPSTSSGRSENGVAEWGQFHLSYTISGANLEPRETVSTGAVQTYHYTGKLAGNTLTISGKGWGDVPVSDPNYPWIVSASVSVDGKTQEFEYKAITPGEKLNKSFSLSVPIPANASRGSLSMNVLYHSAYRIQGNTVTGTFTRGSGEAPAQASPPPLKKDRTIDEMAADSTPSSASACWTGRFMGIDISGYAIEINLVEKNGRVEGGYAYYHKGQGQNVTAVISNAVIEGDVLRGTWKQIKGIMGEGKFEWRWLPNGKCRFLEGTFDGTKYWPRMTRQ